MAHRNTCGRDCPGEPACAETEAVVEGVPVDELRRRFGAQPVDVACPDCAAEPGQRCIGVSTAGVHGTRWRLSRESRKVGQVT